MCDIWSIFRFTGPSSPHDHRIDIFVNETRKRKLWKVSGRIHTERMVHIDRTDTNSHFSICQWSDIVASAAPNRQKKKLLGQREFLFYSTLRTIRISFSARFVHIMHSFTHSKTNTQQIFTHSSPILHAIFIFRRDASRRHNDRHNKTTILSRISQTHHFSVYAF